jgi:hypothetical protein
LLSYGTEGFYQLIGVVFDIGLCCW